VSWRSIFWQERKNCPLFCRAISPIVTGLCTHRLQQEWLVKRQGAKGKLQQLVAPLMANCKDPQNLAFQVCPGSEPKPFQVDLRIKLRDLIACFIMAEVAVGCICYAIYI